MLNKSLKQLLCNVEVVDNNINLKTKISKLCINSNECSKNCLFFCINGFSANGANYVNEAINNGASVIIAETKLNDKIPHIIVKNIREALSIISQNFFNNSHKKLKLIGIVGTNGKTSTAKIMKSMLSNTKQKVGFIGTNMVEYGKEKLDISLTTPDPIELNKYFYNMVKSKIKYCIMEVSAHAIFLKKVYGLKYESLIFTNISQDHLDFFKDMETYSRVKIDFFDIQNTKSAVINIDDEYSSKALKNFKGKVLTYGLNNPSDIFAVNINLDLSGSNFIVNSCDYIFPVKTRLCAKFNVYNILACIGVMKLLKFNDKDIEESTQNLTTIEGRFNQVDLGQPFKVIIDYAHTPKSLENLLIEVKNLSNNKIISVFGCPGNRDETKRKIMGEIAGRYSDYIILTTDNPQYENAKNIIKEIQKGIKKTKSRCELIEDRELAIRRAFQLADDNTTILIIGKGVEKYQNINGFKVPYSDFKVTERLIKDEFIK